MDNKKAILYWDSSEIEANDDFAYDDFIINFQVILDKKMKKYPDGYWKVEMKNFGWRGVDGGKYFKTTKALVFLQEILPNTDCTFYIFNYKNGLKIRNYHHDSPMGTEIYSIIPVKESDYEKGF